MSKESRYSKSTKPKVIAAAFESEYGGVEEEDITITVGDDGSMVVAVHGEPMATLPPEVTPWTPFVEVKQLHGSLSDVTAFSCDGGAKCFINSRYQVMQYENIPMIQNPEVVLTWLSIKRRDKQSCHDWRDFQRIKNELCGDERFGLEVYPPESCLVDTANQYHVWVFPEGMQMPFGFSERLIGRGDGEDEDYEFGRPRQRAFEVRPADAKTTAEMNDIVEKTAEEFGKEEDD